MSRHEHTQATWRDAHLSSEDCAGEVGRRPLRAIPMVDTQLDSRDLFAAGRLVTIAHGEHTYQLRLTAQNKLILTK